MKFAWEGIVSDPLKGRIGKPRTKGVTMVIDKGMGFAQTADFLELASAYTDYIKLTFGTSVLYPKDVLTKKIDLVRSAGVHIYPGGTLFEVAMIQGRLKEYIRRTVELGFDCIEVSDGTIILSGDDRRRAISEGREAGLAVIAEVGKKDSNDQIADELMLLQAKADLDAGASKVIIEGRESGKGVGIYDSSGSIITGKLESIAEGVGADDIMWEAPLKAQQESLILAFGPNVNLGNIPPSEVLALEALRTGFRGDTLKAALS